MHSVCNIPFYKKFSGRWFALLGVVLLTLTACPAKYEGPGNLGFFDGSVNSEGDADFNPTEGDPFNPDPDKTGLEACVNSGTVTINTTTITYGLGQIVANGDLECQSVSLSTCSGFAATIDATTSKSTVDDPGKPGEKVQKPEFVLRDAGAEIQGKAEIVGKNSIEVCYRRLAVGHHTGRVNIVVGSSNAFFVTLDGETLPEIFTVEQPTTNMLVYNQAVQTDETGKKPYSKFFNIPASGTVRVTEYASLIKKTEVFVSVTGGLTKKVALGSDGNFSDTIEIPFWPAKVYPVVFSIETNRGTLTKTIPVIRFYKPAGAVSVVNQDGNIVSVGEETSLSQSTDDIKLTAAVKISNLDASGPNQDHKAKIQLQIRKINAGGQILSYKGLDGNGKPLWVGTGSPEVFEFYKGYDPENEFGEGACPSGIQDADSTFCVPLPPTALLALGINRITATLCNKITDDGLANCEKVHTFFIVDNNLPQIEILSPLEPPQKTHYEMNEPIKLVGTVRNVAVMTVEDNADVNAMEKDDKGKCIKSSLTLWINESVDKTGIPVCVNPIDAKDQGIYSGNKNNIKKASFTIDLTKDYADKLKRYTNLIQLTAENYSGHQAIKVVSFQRGQFNKAKTNPSSGSNLGNIISGNLGEITANKGKTKRSPVMVNISEGSLNNEQLIAVIEHWANENLHFEDLIQGYSPEEKSGDIPDGNDEGDIDPDKNITANSHLAGVAKIMAWKNNNFENLHPNKTANACGFVTDGTCAAILFPKNLNDPRLFGPNLKNESFWSPVVFGKRNTKKELLDVDGEVIPTKKNGWPVDPDDVNDIAPDYNFYDIVQGDITVDTLDLDKDSVTAHLTIHGFTGHAFAFSVCNYGGKTFPPAMPIIFNIKELKLRLDDIQIKKIQLDSHGDEFILEDQVGEKGTVVPENRPCINNNCTNKLIIDPKNIKLDGPADQQSIYMSASQDCSDKEVGAVYTEDHYFEPFGCNLHPDFVANGYPKYNWILLETRNDSDWLTDFPGPGLITQLQEVLRNTIRDQIWCDMPKTLINPIIDPTAFVYPEWFPEEKRTTDLTLAVAKDTKKDEVVFGLLEDLKPHEEAVFTLKPDIKNADLIIENGGIKAKLPLEVGANNLPLDKFSDKPGHMYRDPEDAGFEDVAPRAVDPDKLALSTSLNIEEVLHSALSILLKKDLRETLDLFDVDELTYPTGYTPASDPAFTIGLDKVIFGRFDICNSISSKLLTTDLSPALLFTEISNMFADSAGSTHWDINIDPNQPPTILLEENSGTASMDEATVALGLSNIQVNIRDFVPSKTDNNEYNIEDNVVTLRLDGLLRIKVRYSKETRLLSLFILPLGEQVIYLSVLDPGFSYNHEDVIKTLWQTLIVAAIGKLSSVGSPSFSILLPEKLSDFDNSCTVKTTFDQEVGLPLVKINQCDDDINNDSKEELEKSPAFNGLVIFNHTALGENEKCESDADKPKYANHSLVIPGINTPLADPTENLQLPDQTGPVNWLDLARLNPQLANALEEILGPVENDNKDDDKDEPRTVCLEENEGDNDILESFYDVGIKEITFAQDNPELELDVKNGYIHLSTELNLNVCDDLFKEVNP